MDTTDAPQIIEHIRKSVTCTPYDVKWVPCSARLVCMGINPKVHTHTNISTVESLSESCLLRAA